MSNRRRTSRRAQLVGLTGLVVAALAAACGPSPSSPGSIVSTSTAPGTALASPVATDVPATQAPIGATFPPSQTPIDPGIYRWDGFGDPITLTLDAGWDLGHDNPTFFDLFRGSDFPSITLARFTHVYVDGVTKAPVTDAAAAAATLVGRSDMTLTPPIEITLGGLPGRQFDVTTSTAKTPLFFGRAGDFRLDPEFKTRYRILDLPGGGILVIGIHDHVADFDAAVALADPVVATFSVAP